MDEVSREAADKLSQAVGFRLSGSSRGQNTMADPSYVLLIGEKTASRPRPTPTHKKELFGCVNKFHSIKITTRYLVLSSFDLVRNMGVVPPDLLPPLSPVRCCCTRTSSGG